ncbi:MAG: nitronate monooxygenase [Thermotogae bacterium]|nr:nitronate monooxygenase [Thermotogota bacterium]
MIRTRVNEILGVDYPIIQGGMAWVATPKLAAAVSNAGGLGVVGAAAMAPDRLREAIRETKKLTDKPFGVNLIMISPYFQQQLGVVLEEWVPVITLGAGNPTPYIPKLKEQGIRVAPVVSSDSLARMVERAGADLVITEGMECGGHIGDVTTMVLVPKVVDSVSIPVVAAGGIADGRGFLAALALGAEGIQMGTRFVASVECEAHENYKKMILKASIRDAVVTGAKLGHPARVIKNVFAKQVQKLEVEDPMKAEEILVGSLRCAFLEGDTKNGSFMAGQVSGLIDEIKPVKEIIEGVVEEARRLLVNLFARFGGEV